MNILGYNRVIKNLNGLTEKQFLILIKTNFKIYKLSKPTKPNNKNHISMLLNGNWYSLKVKNKIINNDPVKGLDADILQKYILKPILGIVNPRTNTNIDFVGGVRGLEELESRCNIDSKVAFALYPVSIEDIIAVADANKVMPPKSTWFEPKLRSGLVVRILN